MKRTHHTGMVAGVGTAVGAVILASVGFLAGCAPGTICDKPGYENECVTGGSGGSPSSTGSGGSMSTGTGGMGGMPNAMGGMGGTGNLPKPPACSMSKAEVEEKIIVAKCAMAGGACHATTFPPKFSNGQDAVTALLDKAPLLVCRNDKLINKSDPSKSFIVTKVRGTTAMVACPSTPGMMPPNGGAKMPFMPLPALSAQEADCLEWWAFEVSK